MNSSKFRASGLAKTTVGLSVGAEDGMKSEGAEDGSVDGAEDGLLAYAWIHSWYMQVSGLGVSQKRGWLMSPPQSKKDEDVMYDVQVWMDEERELIAMGEEGLAPGYKITALKRIATQKIQE